jgi:hypothetical protein
MWNLDLSCFCSFFLLLYYKLGNLDRVFNLFLIKRKIYIYYLRHTSSEFQIAIFSEVSFNSTIDLCFKVLAPPSGRGRISKLGIPRIKNFQCMCAIVIGDKINTKLILVHNSSSTYNFLKIYAR